MKKCSKCNIEKDESNFYKSNKSGHKDGLQSRCKKCHKSYRDGHYKANRQKYITKSGDRTKRLRKEWREYKSTLKCIKCGENHPGCLDFHHRNKNDKKYNIGLCVDRFSLDVLKKEIEKCDVLCANCHRKLHYEEKHTVDKMLR